jgi:phospholipase/lecithinase/hemolysin
MKISNILLSLLLITIANQTTAQTLNWFISAGNSTVNYDNASAIKIDPSGDIIVCGTAGGALDLDPSTAAGAINPVGSFDAYIAKYTPSGSLLWAKTITGPSYENITDLALDPQGNIYVTGIFASTADFDPSNANFNLTSYGNSSDFFIAKYTNAGNFLWARGVGSSGNTDNAFGIELDNNNNVIVCGHFTGTAYFDDVNNAAAKTSLGGMDAFIAKYDSAGNYLWANTFGTAIHWERCMDIKLDANNNIYAIGEFYGTLDIDPGSCVSNILSHGGQDHFVSKYNANGTLIWGKALGTAGNDYIPNIKIHNPNYMYLAGTTNDSLDFDLGAGMYYLPTSTQSKRAYIAKYDLNANLISVNRYTDSCSSQIDKLEIASNGDVIVAGGFNTYLTPFDFDLGIGTVTDTSNAVFQSGFVARYDSAMQLKNNFAIQSTYNTQINDMAIDNSSHVYLAGYYTDTLDADPSTAVQTHISNGYEDLFIAKYSLNAPTNIVNATPTNLDFWLYPNPTNGDVKFKLPTDLTDNTKISITDVQGKKVWDKNIENAFTEMPLILPFSKLEAGLYFVSITNKNGISYMKKVMKQ